MSVAPRVPSGGVGAPFLRVLQSVSGDLLEFLAGPRDPLPVHSRNVSLETVLPALLTAGPQTWVEVCVVRLLRSVCAREGLAKQRVTHGARGRARPLGVAGHCPHGNSKAGERGAQGRQSQEGVFAHSCFPLLSTKSELEDGGPTFPP